MIEIVLAIALFGAGYAFRGAIGREIKKASAELQDATAELKAAVSKKL